MFDLRYLLDWLKCAKLTEFGTLDYFLNEIYCSALPKLLSDMCETNCALLLYSLHMPITDREECLNLQSWLVNCVRFTDIRVADSSKQSEL